MAAGASLSLLPCLTDTDLQQMGITALGARKKLLLAAEELACAVEAAAAGGSSGGSSSQQDGEQEGEATAEAAGRQQQQQQAAEQERRESHARAGTSGVGDWRSLAAGSGGAAVVSILQYFKPTGGGKQRQPARDPGSILSYLRGPDGAPLPAPPPRPGAATAAAGAAAAGRRGGQKQWAHKEVAAAGGGGGKRAWGPRGGQVLPMRPWQLVPGTSFVVDRFCNLPAQVGGRGAAADAWPPPPLRRLRWHAAHATAGVPLHAQGPCPDLPLPAPCCTAVALSPLVPHPLPRRWVSWEAWEPAQTPMRLPGLAWGKGHDFYKCAFIEH